MLRDHATHAIGVVLAGLVMLAARPLARLVYGWDWEDQ